MSLSKRILYDLNVTGGRLLSNDMNIGSGTVSNIYMANVSGGSMTLSGDLSVSGTLTTVNITTTNISETNVSASSVVGANVQITNSTVSNILNTNLVSTNNTITNSLVTNLSSGSVFVSGNSTFGSNVVVSGPVLQIPTGNIALRPGAPSGGYIRYNTETSQFEGYGPGNAWGSLGGVVDIAQTTKILASINPSVTDGNLYFYTVGSERVRINSAGNVGIGTTAPTNTLDVTGTARITTSLTTGAVYATNSTVTNSVSTNVTTATLNASTGITTATAQITNANVTTITAGTTLATNVSATTVTAATLLNTNTISTNVTTSTLNASTGITTATAQITNANVTTITAGTTLATNVSATTVTAATLLNTNTISTNVTTSTLNASTGITTATAQITNSNVTTETVGISIITTSLLATGNSNTIGNIFTTNGNVGINIKTPGYHLDVNGNVNVNANLYVDGLISGGTDTGSTFAYLTLTSSDDSVNLSTGSLVTYGGITIQSPTDAQSVTNGGSFLTDGGASIGKSLFIGGPIMKIPVGTTISRPSPADLGYIRYNSTTSQFEGYGPGNAWGSLGGVVDIAQTTKVLASANPSTTDGNLYFYTVGSERIRVNSAGNVGIGTTAPSNNLDVTGTVRVTTSVTTGAIYATNSTITNTVSTNVSSATLNLSTGITTVSAQITNQNVTTQTVATARVTTSLIALGNSNTIGSIFTTGGSVGIGTTSPATDNGSRLSILGSSYDGGAGMLRLYPSSYGSRAVVGFMSGQSSGSYWMLGRQNLTEFSLSLSSGAAGMYFFENGNVSCGPLTTSGLTTGTILATGNVSSGAINATNSTVTNAVATTSSAGTVVATTYTGGSIGLTGAANAVTGTIGTFVSTTSSAGTVVATTYTGGSMSLSGNLAIGGTLTTVNITTTNISETNVSAGTVSATNIGVTTQTVATARVTTSLIALGNSNTVGSIFTTGGNVGIGTPTPGEGFGATIPNAKLTLLSGASGSENVMTRISLGSGSGHYSAIEGGHLTSGQTSLAFMTCLNASTNSGNPLTRMYISREGNIGIGTTSPVYKLHISDTGSSPFSTWIDGTTKTINTGIQVNAATGYAAFLNLQVNGIGPNIVGYVNRLDINQSGMNTCINTYGGNVGIGTTSPGYTLDINGSVQASGTNNTNWIPTCVFTNNSTVGSTAVASFLTPNMPTNSVSSNIYIGKSLSVGNSASLGYFYAGSNNAGNYMSLSHYGKGGGLYINNDGNVGINTVSPSTQLSVNGDFVISANSGAWNSTAGKGLFMRYSTNGGQDGAYIQSIDRTTATTYPLSLVTQTFTVETNFVNRLHITSIGNIGIGTTSPSALFQANTGGTVLMQLNTAGRLSVLDDVIAFASFSDSRLKTDIQTVHEEEAVDVVSKLRPVTFKWKSTISNPGKRGVADIGFIAQEVENLAPYAVEEFTDMTDNVEYKRIKHERLLPYLVASIQNLTRRLNEKCNCCCKCSKLE